MDKKGAAISSGDSFFFQLLPLHFKVSHAFAKTMKNPSTYRLALYKGIQKIDQMSEPVKGKLIGGKILFEHSPLTFALALYSPAKNIEFALKVMEGRPNEPEVEIGQHRIKSGDYIKSFKDDSVSTYREEAQIANSLVLVFNLFVHHSKAGLEQLMKDHQSKSKAEERSRINNRVSPRKAGNNSEVLSQSDLSDNSKEGGMFNSKQKLSRKRGRDGKLRSKHGSSRENSEVSSQEGSVSSRKALGPFPHTEKDQHFIHSPKKVSPPKVNETYSPQRVQDGKKSNLVEVGRRVSKGSEVFKPKQPQTPSKEKKVDSNIERSQSTRKEQRASQILPTETPVSRRQPLAKGEDPLIPSIPNESKSQIHNLQIKGNSKIFDIQQRKGNAGSPKYASNAEPANNSQTLPPKSPKVNNVFPKKIDSPPKQQQSQEKKAEMAKIQLQRIPQQQKGDEKQKKQASQKQGGSVKSGSLKSKDSRFEVPTIAIKGSQLVENEPQLKIKQSINMRKAASEGDNSAEQSVKQQFESGKEILFYILFVVVSLLLFYNAITPSRKV